MGDELSLVEFRLAKTV